MNIANKCLLKYLILKNFYDIIVKKGETMESQKCVLYDRDCIDCMECEMCDLDPGKVCDNCGKCLEMQDYASIRIDGVYDAQGNPFKRSSGRKK